MTSDARSRIEQSLRRAYQQGRNETSPREENARVEIETDRIIQIVREAMLSEEAIEAAEKVIHLLDPEVTISETEHWYRAYYGIGDALDAAFGEKDPTTPRR